MIVKFVFCLTCKLYWIDSRNFKIFLPFFLGNKVSAALLLYWEVKIFCTWPTFNGWKSQFNSRKTHWVSSQFFVICVKSFELSVMGLQFCKGDMLFSILSLMFSGKLRSAVDIPLFRTGCMKEVYVHAQTPLACLDLLFQFSVQSLPPLFPSLLQSFRLVPNG